MISVRHFFDLTSIQFPGEDETVLFAASSGDALRCAATDWDQFLREPSKAPPALSAILNSLGHA